MGGSLNAVRQQDIWKSLGKDYAKRWSIQNWSKKLQHNIMTQWVDSLGTPIITRSPWFINE